MWRYAKSRSRRGTRLSNDVSPCEVRRSSIVRASRGRGIEEVVVVEEEDGLFGWAPPPPPPPGAGDCVAGAAAAADEAVVCCVFGTVEEPVVFCEGWDGPAAEEDGTPFVWGCEDVAIMAGVVVGLDGRQCGINGGKKLRIVVCRLKVGLLSCSAQSSRSSAYLVHPRREVSQLLRTRMKMKLQLLESFSG